MSSTDDGIIVSQPGYDVLTTNAVTSPANIQKMSQHSSYPALRSFATGLVSYTFPSALTSVALTVNIPAIGTTANALASGYQPVGIVFALDDVAQAYPMPFYHLYPSAVSYDLWYYYIHYTPGSSLLQLHLNYEAVVTPPDVASNRTGEVFGFKYYIFVDDGLQAW